MTNGVFLQAYLEPFAPWLNRPDVTDILVNRPGEVWIETQTRRLHRLDAPGATETVLNRLARQIAAASHQGVSREHPLLSASLADGSRVQVIAPPATRGTLALAIRRHAISDLTLRQLGEGGLFDGAETAAMDDDPALRDLLDRGDLEAFLASAIRARRTIVISGGTGSGKTTLLNAITREIPAHERLIAIEDAPELKLHHDNALGLVAVRDEQGEARVDADALLSAALRMRPDRILLGELRGKEAFAFLRAVNTGHPGSITTVHANSAEAALDQIALLSLTSGVQLDWALARTYVRQIIDVVVQLERTASGARRVREVVFRPSDLRRNQGSAG